MSFVEKRNGDFVSGAHFVQEVKRRLLRKGLAVVRAHALLALHACALELGNVCQAREPIASAVKDEYFVRPMVLEKTLRAARSKKPS